MRDALLFRCSSPFGPPEWLVCLDDQATLDFYTKQGTWIFLVSQSEVEAQRSADIQAVRQSDENKWAPPLERRRRRWRSRRRRAGSTGE